MTSPNRQALADHVRHEMAERHWTQKRLAEAMGLEDPKQVNTIANARHVGQPTYARLEAALGWPAGRVRQILAGEELREDDEPSIELALQRLHTAKESVRAAERILRLLQRE